MAEQVAYQRLSSGISHLMVRFGTDDYQLRQKSLGTVFKDPLKPTMGYITSDTITPILSAFSTYTAEQKKSELIQVTDRPFYVSITGGVILVEIDTIEKIGTDISFEIISVQTYEVSGNDLVYLLQLRGE